MAVFWSLGSVLRAASATALLATVLLGLDYLDWLLDVRPTDLGLFAGFAAAIRTRIGVVEGSRVLLAGLTFFLAGGARAGRLAGFLAMLGVVVGAAAGHPATIEPAMSAPVLATTRPVKVEALKPWSRVATRYCSTASRV